MAEEHLLAQVAEEAYFAYWYAHSAGEEPPHGQRHAVATGAWNAAAAAVAQLVREQVYTEMRQRLWTSAMRQAQQSRN